MSSLQENSILVDKICQIYDNISNLQTLKPSKNVDTLFTHLVLTCIQPSSIQVSNLPHNIQQIRSNLIRLCAEAEGYLEAHFSTLLATFDNPLHHLDIFPYYSNYLKLSRIEFDILIRHYPDGTGPPKRVAFVGSGPLPLTSIVLASCHLKETTFHNYDIDPIANEMASRLVLPDPDLSQRMRFHTSDVSDVSDELREYDVVFLAALVGMDVDEKVKVVRHLAKYMAPGSILMVRSAHGARAFLYPVVEPEILQGFEVLSVFHPDDDVINSVVIARRDAITTNNDHQHHMHHHDHHNHDLVHQLDIESIIPSSCKYCEFQMFNNPLNQMTMIEELAIDE